MMRSGSQIKWILAAAIIVQMLWLLSCSESNADQRFTGRYTGTQDFGIGQVSSPFVLDLVQRGNSISGSVTPPFSNQLIAFTNASLNGNSLQFDRKDGSVTYRYRALLSDGGVQATRINGSIDPLGCLDPNSGELCFTDLDGSFTATRK